MQGLDGASGGWAGFQELSGTRSVTSTTPGGNDESPLGSVLSEASSESEDHKSSLLRETLGKSYSRAASLELAPQLATTVNDWEAETTELRVGSRLERCPVSPSSGCLAVPPVGGIVPWAHLGSSLERQG